MKASTLGALMAAASIAACFVDRPSQAFECDTDEACAGFPDNRVCSSGYCVIAQCPALCPQCDEGTKSCPIDCTTTDDCGTVTCPAGWSCSINCVGPNACGNIICQPGSKCAVACSGLDACETLDCDTACQCDLTCDQAGGACNPPSCPVVGNGANQMECTVGGIAGANCQSTRAAGCTKC